MLPSFLGRNDLRFILFGGKGGTGKTTLACASALYLAEQRPAKKILIVSTDPAHSVGDSLDQAIGDRAVPVRGAGNLYARELAAERLLAEFKLKHGPILAEIAGRGTYFDKEDIRGFLDLSLPGMDEFMAIRELMELVKAQQYDLIILDTAPTGHTIRLLELPGLMQQWVSTLDLMMEKHRFLSKTFSRRRYMPDECDRWLEIMARDAKRVEQLLQDTAATEFVLVTIPEAMAVAETERLLATLARLRIPVRNLIVNHVVNPDGLCSSCRQRRAEQLGLLGKIEREFTDLSLLNVPQLPYEVRGVQHLSQFAQFLIGVPPGTVETRPSTVQAGPSNVASDGLLLPSSHLVLVGGKGGVGKTVVAAATARKLASQLPEKRILVFSTGAAHSLSDCFDQKIGAELTAIEGYHNLYAQEIDAPRLLDDFKRQYREVIYELFNSFPGGRDVKVEYDQKVMERLLDLSPSGLDEAMALMEVMELVERHEFDILILDTAATGHLIRFLEMPDIVRNWLSTATKMLLKYRGMIRLGAAADLVLKYARQVRKLRKQLLDATDTEFIAVTIPETMGIVEMERLLQALSRFEIACRQIVINMVTPPSDCSFCSMKRGEEQSYVQQVVARHPDYRVAGAPKLLHPVRGLKNLLEFGQILYPDQAQS